VCVIIVTPPISAHHYLNRDNFEPNIDSVGTPPNGLAQIGGYA
jgi:hypothetical protein